MVNQDCDILIIGAGLTGLTLAYLLRTESVNVQLLEARERIGGRIDTGRLTQHAPVEYGATWLGKKHTALSTLLEDLDLSVFEQRLGDTAIYEPISTSPPQLVKLPPNDEPSYRIQGGSSTLINTLSQQLANNCSIHTGQVVKAITLTDENVVVTSSSGKIKCKTVVSTLPPYLLAKTVKCTPSLSPEMSQLMLQTHTWMGESIKIALHYASPFWRSSGLSGTMFSSVGPVSELYDHSNVEDNLFALKGFLNGAYHTVSKDERKQLVVQQLQRYFGKQATKFIRYEEKVWRQESFTFLPYQQHVLPHQNNGHPSYRETLWNDRLFLAGSETAARFPGYMDGAVRSAQYVFDQLARNR